MAIQRKSFAHVFLIFIVLFSIYLYEYDQSFYQSVKTSSLGITIKKKNNVTVVGRNDDGDNEEKKEQNPLHNNDNESEEDMETHLQHVINKNATGNVLTETDAGVNENISNDNKSNEDENKKNETAIGHESGEDMETHLQHVIKQNETGNILIETVSDVNVNSSNDNVSNVDDNGDLQTNIMNMTATGNNDDNDDVLYSWDNSTFRDILERRQHSSSNIQVILPNNITGEVLSDGQLVVNLINRTDHMLWYYGQTKLCNLLKLMTLSDTIPEAEDRAEMPRRPLLNYTFACNDYFIPHGNIGEGNWIVAVYNTRLTAAAARVDFQFNCYEGSKHQIRRILPWLQTYQSAPLTPNLWPYKGRLPTNNEACSDHYRNIRIDFMIDEIMHDMQKMAVTLIGSSKDKQHHDVPIDQPPLIQGIEVEDVVIHFRCGDIMGGVVRSDFGIIKFSEYTKWISKDTRTIGIVTQPFDKDLNRAHDKSNVDACRSVTYLLVKKLQEFLPSAKISIHNDKNETLPLTYARLIMANQSFTTLSSFGIFPVIGGFGRGYFQRGHRGLNMFANYLPEYYPEKLFIMDGEFMSSTEISRNGLPFVENWLVE